MAKIWVAAGVIAAELGVLVWLVGEHAWHWLASYGGAI